MSGFLYNARLYNQGQYNGGDLIPAGTFIPDTKALVLTTYAPTILTGSKIVIPDTKALTLTKYAPVLAFVIIPAVLALTLTKYAPSAVVEEVPTGLLRTDLGPVAVGTLHRRRKRGV